MRTEQIFIVQDTMDAYAQKQRVLHIILKKYVVDGGDVSQLYTEDEDLRRYIKWLEEAFDGGEIWNPEEDDE